MSLTQVANYSFTGNHLFQISLMRDDSDEQERKFKRKYFVFLSLAPGEKTPTGRTFKFEDRITLKVDLEKILAFGYAIEAYARGQEHQLGNFQIYTDSSRSSYGGNESKTIYLKNKTSTNGDQIDRIVGIGFRLGQGQVHQFNVSPFTAFAIADICKKIALIGIEKELLKDIDAEPISSYPQKVKSNGEQKIKPPAVPKSSASNEIIIEEDVF